MQTSSYTVHAQRRDITFRSTNHLLGRDDLSVRAAKTGFISKSGYCLATLLRLPRERPAGGGRGAGRAFERRSFPRDPESLQLVRGQGVDDFRDRHPSRSAGLILRSTYPA